MEILQWNMGTIANREALEQEIYSKKIDAKMQDAGLPVVHWADRFRKYFHG